MININKRVGVVLVVFLFLFRFVAFAQDNSTIKGKVVDKAGNPVGAVVVSLSDDFTQTVTNNAGEFSITTSAGKSLLFSKNGFIQQKAVAEKNKALTIVLEKSNEDNLFNVAYGVRSKYNLTSAISTASADDLAKSPVSTLGNAVQGLGNGLTTLHTGGGEPGWDQPTIYIRGVQTFGSGSAPLVVVDNVERDFSQLDPNEIESFTILKDAAATAMYGMRGANGVILVNTKKGFVGKTQISLTAQYGVQSPTRLPNYLGSRDFVKYRNGALRSDYSKLSDSEFTGLFLNDPKNNAANYNGSNPYLYPNTDWYNAMIKPTSPQQTYNLSFRGGSDFVKYYLMLGVVDQAGLYNYTEENKGYSTQNEFSRYNFRTNVDVNLTNNFQVGINLGGRVENRHTPSSSSGSIITALSKNSPTMPIFNQDNSLAGTSVYTNPYGLIANSGFQDRFARYLQGTVTANLKLDDVLKGLSANGLFGFDAYKLYGRSKDQSFAVYQQNADNTYSQFGQNSSLSLLYNGWDSSFGLMMDYMAGISYERIFGSHAVAADIKYMQSNLSVDGDNPDYRNQGLFGRATYTFDKRYTAEFGFAYNGSEDFAKEHRFGFFPVISGAWVVSNEDFLKGNDVVDFLKVRASYGKVGNSNIGVGYRFPFEEKFYSGGGYYFGTSSTDGAYEGRISNPNITWEQSLNANVGFDVELLKMLEVNIDLFHNNRTHIITDPSNVLPLFVGQDLPYVNSGAVLSQGFEIGLKHSQRINKFGYSVQANISFANNTISEKNEVAGMNSWEYRKNHSVMQQWGLEVAPDKFFKDQSDIDNWAKSSYGSVQPGDVKYIDQNKDGVIDNQDMVPLGKPSIPEWNFGLTLGCDYKGFYFNTLLTAVANRSLFMNNNVFWGMQNNNKVTAEVAENSWGVNSNPQYPRLTTLSNPNNYQPSSLWLKNVDYLRIQSIELGYSLPQKVLSKLNINEVKFFVKGYNLFSFDGLRKYNLSAEVPNAGVTQYPEIRVINIGTSLKF